LPVSRGKNPPCRWETAVFLFLLPPSVLLVTLNCSRFPKKFRSGPVLANGLSAKRHPNVCCNGLPRMLQQTAPGLLPGTSTELKRRIEGGKTRPTNPEVGRGFRIFGLFPAGSGWLVQGKRQSRNERRGPANTAPKCYTSETGESEVARGGNLV